MLRSGTNGDWIGTFLGHKGAVWSCVLDPTATLAATGSADFSAKVWDALTGLEKANLQHKHIVRTLCFTPCSTKLVTGGHEKLLRLFDVDRPEAAPVEMQGATGVIRGSLFVGAGGQQLVTSTSDVPGLLVWDMRSGKVEQNLTTEAPVGSMDLTHDGRWLTTTDGNTVRVWDAANLSAPVKNLTVPYPLEAASYCPAKNRFVAGGGDMWVHLHDAETGAELEVNKGHHGPVHTVRFGPEGKEYASGSEDGTIRIWQTDWQQQQPGAEQQQQQQQPAQVQANGSVANGRKA
jgi:serine-threonine kinase receptor-associated protein